jgi:thiol-disulfide isomerase/thioredoxin
MEKYIATIILIMTLLFTSASVSAQTPAATGLEIGNILPDITLNDMNGNPHSISQLRGNIVFVDFWASWCRPCRRENPVVVQTFKDYQNKKFKGASGFEIYSVSFDNTRDDWSKAIEADGLTWNNNVSDLLGWRSVAAKKFNVRAIPMNYLIDQNGVIIAKNLRGEQLAEALLKLAKD